ncbi:hypothetical protein [Paraburkholderia atlantica]|uniref:hypothetical protein n=1 Tax=Paraburkholderia atlantica TaxID=2654982 RepID=UPI003D20177F
MTQAGAINASLRTAAKHGGAQPGRDHAVLSPWESRPDVGGEKRPAVRVTRVDLEEDGEATSLGDLGYFANRQSALAFAMRCATAFADDEPMPKPPCEIVHVTGAGQMSLSEDAENAAPDERAVSIVAS